MIYQLPGGQWQTTGFGQTKILSLPGGVWEKRATSGLVVPRRGSLLGSDGEWHPLSSKPMPSYGNAFGVVDVPAWPDTGDPWAGYVWDKMASPEEYAQGLNRGIGAITDDVKAQIAANNPELGIAIDGMSSIITAVTGEKAGWPLALEIAKILADVMLDMLRGDGALGVALKGALETAAKAIGSSVAEIGQVVPFVGMLIEIVFAIIEGATYPKITEKEGEILEEKYEAACRSYTKHLRGTGYKGVSIADMFTQNDSRARLWRWLAAGASRTEQVRNAYNSWLNAAKGQFNITGIPPHIQRQMQELMDGIFAARRDPDAPLGTMEYTDNGAGLGSILLEITYIQGVAGAFNKASLQSMADSFVAPGERFCIKREYPATGLACQDFPPCSSIGLKIGEMFFDFIKQYERKYNDPMARLEAEQLVKDRPKTSTLILTPVLAQKLVSDVGDTITTHDQAVAEAKQLAANAAAKKSSVTKAAAVSSALLLGGGGFLLARRAAKKRRR